MITLLNQGVRKFTININGKVVNFLPKNIIKVNEEQASILLKYSDIVELKEQKISYEEREEMKNILEENKRRRGRKKLNEE